MKSKTNFKAFVLLLVLLNLFFSVVDLAYAQQSTYINYEGKTVPYEQTVESSIEKFLCAPTKGSTGTWFKPGGVSGTEAANNQASSDLYVCINRLYRFAIVFGSIVGIMMIVVAGYVYMSADGSQEAVDKAKSIFTSTIVSMVILFSGYLLLRTLNPDLISFKSIQPPSIVPPTTLTTAVYGQDLSHISEPAGAGGICKETATNLCQASASGCSTNACNNYAGPIKEAAAKFPINGINTEALIRSVMYNESKCSPSATSNSNPPSCGIMQLQPSTANLLKSACGVTDNITCEWLNNSNNTAKSICIGAYYLKQVTNTCGNNIVNIAAGYNAGATACQPSVTCSGETSCSGGSKRKWECLYDGPAGSRARCNTGYTETRLYAPKVLDCYNKNK